MSNYVSPVDPPDLGMLPTFRRLLRLWREQWRLGAIGLSCALAYTLLGHERHHLRVLRERYLTA